MAQRPQDDVKDVRVAAHSIVLPHGKFCISVAEVTPNVPPARLPGVSVTAIPGQGSTVAFARMAGEEWLREPGDAVLVAVSSQEARILLTSYNLSASTDVKPPRMHIQRLDSPPARQAAPPPAPIAQGPAKAGDVLVHVARRGDLQGAFGDWLGEQGDGLWIEGVQIEPPKGLPPEALEYQVVLGKGWTSPWSSGGEYCGSRGMTLPVQGIRVALRGEVADRFTVTCEARTVSGRELGPVSAGELCGLDDPQIAGRDPPCDRASRRRTGIRPTPAGPALSLAPMAGSRAASGQKASAREPVMLDAGAVEAFGLLDAVGTLLLEGWCESPWAETTGPDELNLRTGLGRLTGPAASIFLPQGARWRFVTLLRIPPVPRLEPQCLELREPARRLELAHGTRPMSVVQAARYLRRALRDAPEEPRAALLRQAPRLPHDPAATLAKLGASAVHVELDRVMRAGDAGVVAFGWLLDPGRQVLELRLCTATEAVVLHPGEWAMVSRPDVARAIGATYGLEGEDWGFCAFAALTPAPGESCYLEVVLANGEVGQKSVGVVEAAGMASLRQILSLPRQPGPRLARILGATLGPALEALNGERLQRPRRSSEIVLGSQPVAPRVSLVVTLYGRVDFMDMQLGLFSAAPDPHVEIIYVLDDPRRAAEAERLAQSCHARHGLPFRLILLEENQGFAVANNEGAAVARGRHICLMNSDVFPLAQQGMGFLSGLAERLEADAGLGVVGPLLLYEDGTVQHAGMAYERVHGLPDWSFPVHPGKARPPGMVGLQEALAITGACMMLRRADWQALAGFDEGYVIGDFEDSDLCLRLRERGLRCAVDAGWTLYHLERQSQEGEAAWRFNTTLFNAWRHNRRWGSSDLMEAGQG